MLIPFAEPMRLCYSQQSRCVGAARKCAIVDSDSGAEIRNSTPPHKGHLETIVCRSHSDEKTRRYFDGSLALSGLAGAIDTCIFPNFFCVCVCHCVNRNLCCAVRRAHAKNVETNIAVRIYLCTRDTHVHRPDRSDVRFINCTVRISIRPHDDTSFSVHLSECRRAHNVHNEV